MAQQRVGRAVHGVYASGMVPWMVSRGTICKTAWAVLRGLEEEETAGDRPWRSRRGTGYWPCIRLQTSRLRLKQKMAARRYTMLPPPPGCQWYTSSSKLGRMCISGGSNDAE